MLGFLDDKCPIFAPVAQWIEYTRPKGRDGGSTPPGGVKLSF